jgi:hypothetical protein
LGTAKFCFYLTWKKPEYSKFEDAADKSVSMQIKFNANSKKPNILETLLWLGCDQAKGKGKTLATKEQNEEQIVDAIFKIFETLKVTRRREGTSFLTNDWSTQGLGYWRNESAITGTGIETARAATTTGNAIKYLLSYGEARCGEWTSFFVHILLTQGLDVKNDTKAICTEWASPGYPTYTEKEISYGTLGLSLEFAVKNAIHNDAAILRSTSGNSPGQGNPTSQPTFSDHVWFYYKKKRYFDVSYGKSFSDTDSNLKEYCLKSLSSVYLAPITMTTIPASYPGGVGTIITTNIHNHLKSTV